jgi:hypothetical protein
MAALTDTELIRKYVLESARKGKKLSCKEVGGVVPPSNEYT